MLMRPQALFQSPYWKAGSPIGFTLQFPNSKSFEKYDDRNFAVTSQPSHFKCWDVCEGTDLHPQYKDKFIRLFGNVKKLMTQFK